MDSTTVVAVVTDVQTIGDAILEEVGALVPGTAVPAAAAEKILDLLAELASKAITAWGAASNTPINAETIAALLPNATPLSPPDPD